MKGYLMNKGKSALRKVWVRAFLVGAVFSAIAVSVFYSKDRWSSLGVIGTWATGAFAAIIAWVQHKEQKIKIANIQSGVEHEIEQTSHIIASNITNICTDIRSWAENFTITDDGDISSIFITRILDNKNLWPSVQIHSYQRELLEHAFISKIDVFNNYIDVLPAVLRNNVPPYPGDAFLTLSRYSALLTQIMLSSSHLKHIGYDQFDALLGTIKETIAVIDRIKNVHPNSYALSR